VTTFLLSYRRAIAAIIVLAGVLSLVCAAANSGHLSLFPPRPAHAQLSSATATSHVLVDLPDPSLLYRRVEMAALADRGELLGRVLASPTGLALLARHAGVDPKELAGLARTVADVPTSLTDPGLEQRANEIAGSHKPYRIEVQARQYVPIIDTYVQAPSAPEAERIANAVAPALDEYLRTLAAHDGVAYPTLALKQLGPARGGMVNNRGAMIVATLTLMVTFPLFCLLGIGLLWLRVRRRLPAPAPPAAPHLDHWPHTNRVMPWMLAGFIAMLWLVPFNQAKLNASLPVDVQLDRIFLPLLFGVWVFAIAIGGRAAGRLRVTWIHVALGIFLLDAFLSVVLNARSITHLLELDLAIKQLPLLLSYVSLFLIASTVVRPAEVRAYFDFTLVLAVICGIGMIWEYRTTTNIFYLVTDKVLPGAFSIQSSGDGVLDSLGRREVHGPAEPGVEAVTMLSMAMPIAFVGFMHAKERRRRILYGIAAAVLVAATFATFRKSALVAPISVALTLAYFRRRELLRLAPLGLVLMVVVSLLAPGALQTILGQFFRADAASVPTTSDRTSDYDAIRPDLWSHLLFGRGWGTYNHESYRILDSEVLHRLVDVGVLGLLAFVGIGVSVVLSARATIRARDDDWAPLALMGACAAVCFTCASSLYDSLSFPHGTYIFLYLSALVAVVVGRPREGPAPPPEPVARARMPEPRRVPVAAGVGDGG
jgi:hypothetical protein